MDIARLYNLDGQKVYYELVKLERRGLVRRRMWPSNYPDGKIMWYPVERDKGRETETVGDTGNDGC